MKVSELLKEVYNGSVVLPEFQRSFIWEPEDIRELLVSILGNYVIGSILCLELYKDESPFALRLIEGVEKVNNNVQMQSIVKILLDGQQRVTSLFYALYKPDISLKNKKNAYQFYLDLEKAFDEDWDDAVIAVSTSNKKKLMEINTEIEKNNIIPFDLIKDIRNLAEKFKEDPDRLMKIINLANNFLNYEIHIVPLPRETDLEKIVEIFERINRTGEPLSTFELLTARLYKYNIKLRDLLEKVNEKYNFAKSVPAEFILKVIALLRGRVLKRKNILELEPENFEKDWERACKALEDAYTRVKDLKNGYGVLDFKKWMPYTTMLVPLAAIIDFIKTNKKETIENYHKIDCWYWAAVFSNRYDHAVDTTSSIDFKDLKTWIDNSDKVPDFIQKFNVDEIDLDTDKQSSAIYRGVISIIVLQGALDFKTGQPPQFEIKKIQDDHIFPKSIYNDNSVLNRTLISTNAEKSNKKPSEYFNSLLTIHGKEKLKEILESHIIPSDALEDLLTDNKENFKNKRKNAIIECLKKRLNLNYAT